MAKHESSPKQNEKRPEGQRPGAAMSEHTRQILANVQTRPSDVPIGMIKQAHGFKTQ